MQTKWQVWLKRGQSQRMICSIYDPSQVLWSKDSSLFAISILWQCWLLVKIPRRQDLVIFYSNDNSDNKTDFCTTCVCAQDNKVDTFTYDTCGNKSLCE